MDGIRQKKEGAEAYHKVALISRLVYTGISLGLAFLFLLVTGGGRYDNVARYGGAAWVFLLTMIITMPAVIPWVKKRYQK